MTREEREAILSVGCHRHFADVVLPEFTRRWARIYKDLYGDDFEPAVLLSSAILSLDRVRPDSLLTLTVEFLDD